MMRYSQRKKSFGTQKGFGTQKSFGTQKGFALPMAILAISGMLIILVGLLAVLAQERKTARSYTDATRAELALQSGLADAIATISPVASRDDTLVFRVDDPSQQNTRIPTTAIQKYFTFGSTYDTAKKEWRILPFFSGMKEMNHVMQEHATSSNNPPSSVKTISDQLLKLNLVPIAPGIPTDRDEPRAQWIDLNDPTTNPNADPDPAYRTRFAWWVEDLSGRIDGKNAGSQPRIASLDPRETGLYTIFNPVSDRTIPGGPADTLVAKKDVLRSSGSIRTVLQPADAEKIEPWITYSLPKQNATAPLIPHGFGYADAGQPASDLNKLIAERSVDGIAQHIDRNLPQWNTTRKGGFPATENYTKTLAASIIDYADADSDATIGTGYRGVDSYPFVNELYDRYEWTNLANGNVTIRVTTYVEMWNMSQQEISGNIEFENVNLHQIQIPLTGTRLFTPVNYTISGATRFSPNEFLVFNCGSRDYQFPVGAFPPSSLTLSTTTTSSFNLKWNGRIVDTARGKLQRQNPSLRGGIPKWVGNATCPSNWSSNQFGDPRSNYYTSQFWFSNTYSGPTANSSFGGRNVLRDEMQPIPKSFAQQLISRWLDNGWDTQPGPAPSSDNVTPDNLRPQFPPTESKKAPAFISNRGRLMAVAECGNVFDPAQWNSWTNPNAGIDSRSGGGISLAIGRPEFGTFDKQGLRAAQLLDLFHTPPADPLSNVPKININTAPREALRTLIAGQELTLDPQIGTLFPPKRTEVGDRFADAVIATRTRGPLRALSDLNLIRINPNTPRIYYAPPTTPPSTAEDTEPFFGSRLQYPQANRPADNWDDAGREELFRRVSNLVTFQSKTFRIIVAGEVLDRAGKVVGRRSREFHVQLEPVRNPDNTVDTTKPVSVKVVFTRSL